MSKNRFNQSKPSFLRNHADTIAIIGIVLAVNLTIAAMLLSLIISNSNRIDAANTRSDQLFNKLCELIQEGRK